MNNLERNLLIAPFIPTDWVFFDYRPARKLELYTRAIRHCAGCLHNLAVNRGLYPGDDWGQLVAEYVNRETIARWVHDAWAEGIFDIEE
jgi:hypothetical protein